MPLLLWMASGIFAGWLIGLVMTGRGYGLIGDLVVGSMGGLLGGWFLARSGAFALPSHWFGHIVVATVGGIVLVGATRLLRRL